MAERTPRSPAEVAEGAINRLCAYDAKGDAHDWQTTGERIAEFQVAFLGLAAERLINVVSKGDDDA